MQPVHQPVCVCVGGGVVSLGWGSCIVPGVALGAFCIAARGTGQTQQVNSASREHMHSYVSLSNAVNSLRIAQACG
jgi:hypothetical protein